MNATLEKLHTAFNELAPDASVQRALVQNRREMEKANETEKEIMLMIACSITDGLL